VKHQLDKLHSLLALQRLGLRKMEAFIFMLVATIGGCFFIEIYLAKPDWGGIALGFVPHLHPSELFVAAGDNGLHRLLIMGSHGHRGLDDLVFGQTVSAVRHAIDIPVLVVRSYGRERAQRSRHGFTG